MGSRGAVHGAVSMRTCFGVASVGASHPAPPRDAGSSWYVGTTMVKTVAHLLEDKASGTGSPVWSATPDTSVYEALEMMAENNIGALVVLDGNRLVGIVSERDYARKVILRDRASRDTTVGDIMTADPVTVPPTTSVSECMQLMTDNRFRHLPVIAETRELVGVISIGDVVRAVIEEQRYLIQQLEGYITG